MKGMRCVVCGKVAAPAKLRFQGIEINGWKCKCGEEYFDPETAEKILLLNKLKRQRVLVKIGQVRSNMILRIPKAMADALGIKKGDVVTLSLGDREIKVAI
jgi:phage FluMu protein Com